MKFSSQSQSPYSSEEISPSRCPHKVEHFMQMLSKRREDTWKLLGGSCIFCIFYLNTVLVYWLVYILYISSPHQSTTSHPPSLLLVHFILHSHKSSSALPSWGEISTNVLSSEKFEALELLVEGWTPLPDIQYTQSTTLTRSMVS